MKSTLLYLGISLILSGCISGAVVRLAVPPITTGNSAEAQGQACGVASGQLSCYFAGITLIVVHCIRRFAVRNKEASLPRIRGVWVRCPDCGRRMKVPGDSIGGKVQCRDCELSFTARPDKGGGETRVRTEAPLRSAPAESGEQDDADPAGEGAGERRRAGIPYWAWPTGGAAALLLLLVILACGGILYFNVGDPPSPNKPNTQGKSPATPPATPAPPAEPPPPGAELLQNGFSYTYRIEGDNDVLALTNRKADFRQGQLTLMWRQNGTVSRQAVYNIASWKAGETQELLIPRSQNPTDLKFQFRFLIGTSTFTGTAPLSNPPG